MQIWVLGDAGEEAVVPCSLRGENAVDVLVSERRAENEKAIAFAAVAAQVGDVSRLLSSCVSNTGFATAELDARVLAKCPPASVLQLPDAFGNCDDRNVVSSPSTSPSTTRGRGPYEVVATLSVTMGEREHQASCVPVP